MDISTEEGKALWMVTAVVMSHGGQLGVCVCVWFVICGFLCACVAVHS